MSGGHFNHSNYVFNDIKTEIEELIYSNDKEDEYGYKRGYNKKTLNEFKKAIEILKLADIYTHRIDWLVSDDDGENDFHARLKEELDKLSR